VEASAPCPLSAVGILGRGTAVPNGCSYRDGETGSFVLFGGIDPNYTTKGIYWVPLSAETYWQITMDRYCWRRWDRARVVTSHISPLGSVQGHRWQQVRRLLLHLPGHRGYWHLAASHAPRRLQSHHQGPGCQLRRRGEAGGPGDPQDSGSSLKAEVLLWGTWFREGH